MPSCLFPLPDALHPLLSHPSRPGSIPSVPWSLTWTRSPLVQQDPSPPTLSLRSCSNSAPHSRPSPPHVTGYACASPLTWTGRSFKGRTLLLPTFLSPRLNKSKWQSCWWNRTELIRIDLDEDPVPLWKACWPSHTNHTAGRRGTGFDSISPGFETGFPHPLSSVTLAKRLTHSGPQCPYR